MVREGSRVDPGRSLVLIRNLELERELAATALAVDSLGLLATRARARGDEGTAGRITAQAQAEGARLAGMRERVRSLVIRAPVAGVVASPRPDTLLGRTISLGDTLLHLTGDRVEARIALGGSRCLAGARGTTCQVDRPRRPGGADRGDRLQRGSFGHTRRNGGDPGPPGRDGGAPAGHDRRRPNHASGRATCGVRCGGRSGAGFGPTSCSELGAEFPTCAAGAGARPWKFTHRGTSHSARHAPAGAAGLRGEVSGRARGRQGRERADLSRHATGRGSGSPSRCSTRSSWSASRAIASSGRSGSRPGSSIRASPGCWIRASWTGSSTTS